MCLVSVFTLSLTLHPATMRTRMGHNLAPNVGLEANAEMKNMNDNWLGKPAVITCGEVTPAQLPHVLECVQCIVGIELVVFNHRTDNLHSDSLQSVQSGYHSNAAIPAMLGTTDPTILNKILGIPCFLGTEREKDTVRFEQWYHAISDAQKNFNEQLVRGAITKSCVGDVADAMCCLPPGLPWMISWKSSNHYMGL